MTSSRFGWLFFGKEEEKRKKKTQILETQPNSFTLSNVSKIDVCAQVCPKRKTAGYTFSSTPTSYLFNKQKKMKECIAFCLAFVH